MYLRGIILHCQLHIKQSRSIFSIYHLLKGKRGIQTVHDARLFQLENIFGIYQSLDKDVFEREIKSLTKGKYLMPTDTENVYLVTNKATIWLDEYRNHLRLEYFNGLVHSQLGGVFLERLILIIQTYTNLHKNSYSFIPAVDTVSITSWVKEYYQSTKSISPEKILHYIYSDLKRLLVKFTDNEAKFFLDHLSGYKSYGLASGQLAEKYNLQNIDIPLLRTAIIHKMLTIIKKEKTYLKVLPSLIIEKSVNPFITQTTMTTYNLLNSGASLEEISVIRNLKINTIHDHIVEIALFDPDFDIKDYVNNSSINEIKAAVSNTETYKLRDIKEKISKNISYFQIRLVLTRTK